MAEVAKSVVSEPERQDEEVSLQELIDSELALRVPAKSHSFTRDFLNAEREHSEASCPPPLSVLVLNQQNLSHNNQEQEWTTVEEVAKDIQTNQNGENGDDQVTVTTTINHHQITEKTTNHTQIIEERVIETIETVEKFVTSEQLSEGDVETESVETTLSEKKKKKKNSVGEGDMVVTKTKKTKKSKKTEEKENHISVMTNGHTSSPERSPSPPPKIVNEDELSNVCVKNLKLNYVNEANKSFSVQAKLSEIPVPPPVSIRELRRSFGDIHKACENADLVQSTNSDIQLAAAYWKTVSIENNLNEHDNKRIGRLDKSSFSKFDQLSKKVLHVRSSDPAKASKTFSQGSDGQATSTCKACGKTVFAMEQIKAERAVWHKNCFRCNTCKKQLTVDIYSSHEGELYCKPHFKELFKPKVVIDQEEEPVRRRKPEMIIRENQPMELPPDVVRASDKPDLGLEELSSLNVKSRFQVFEKHDTTDGELERSPTTVSVKRSSSILSKLAKFQKKGMDVGVTDDAIGNGFIYEASSSSEEEDEEDEEEETGIIKCRRKVRERPMSFGKIDDVKKSWESQHDQHTRREMMREQKKEELQNLRSRLFMGKQGKMKELYEQAVAESEGKPAKNSENDIVRSDKAKLVKEKFEKGETVHSDSDEEGNKAKKVDEDMSVFEEGISKKSRSLFLQMDANAAKTQASIVPPTPPPKEAKPKMAREVFYSRQASDDVVRSSDVVEDAVIETADLSSKFKFFETYKPTQKERKTFRITPPREGQVKTDSPEREVYRDPDVVRCDDKIEDEQAVKKSQTASRMLSLFKQMEEQKEVLPDGPKPPKRFTPPPDCRGGSDSGSDSEEDDDEDDEEEDDEEDESEREDGVVRSSYKVKDEFLEQARNAARAKQLAAKFEAWEPDKQSNNNAITMLDSEHASIDSTKSLRAKFESLKSEQPKEKSRPKVNRFVEPVPSALCASCDTKVYPLEKIETNGKLFHRQCFKCTYCKCILRMDSYTLNNGQLYCLTHFKQLFISKGNYDEGFGSNQHKRKWETPAN